METGSRKTSGIAGTVGAFRFIRRVGFPPTIEVVSIFSTIVTLVAIIALPSTGLTLAQTLRLAILVIILPALVGELSNSTITLYGDPVLTFRRLMGMELLSWWSLIIIFPLSAITGRLVGAQGLWADGLFLALALSLPLRYLAIFSISSLETWRKLLAGATVPVLAVLGYTLTFSSSSTLSGGQSLAGFVVLVAGLIFSALGVAGIIRNVERAGTPSIGDSPMDLFRTFLRHWLKSEGNSLEDRLTRLGSTAEIHTSILSFLGADKKTKSCVIVSDFHPGPYRDLGSGGLPSTLKAAVETTVGGVAHVPHGISNHEHNIISREDINQLLQEINKHYPQNSESSTASRLIRAGAGEAKASAQSFGKTVLLTLTLAPHDMEDIPEEVQEAIERTASERGFRAIVADAHNSLSSQTSITQRQANELIEAATKALDSVKQAQQAPFKAGAAADPLAEFRLEDGIGPGGLSVLTVKTDGQLTAYITVDGNNMETGFRGRVLHALKEVGADEGEIMTTDTHLVTGLVRSPLGYHPVGEHIDKDLFIRKVKETVRRAISNMDNSAAGFSQFNLKLRVLGSETFESITSFVGRIASRVGRSFYRLEIATFIITLLILSLV